MRRSSLERHRLLLLYLEDRLNFKSEHLNMLMLHVAPSLALQERLASKTGIRHVTGDLFAHDVMLMFDVEELPFADNTFDALLCNHILEHVPNDQQAMRELFRVIKPGKWTILQSPIDPTLEVTFEDARVTTPEDRERLFWQRDHRKVYGRDYD